VRKVNPDLQAQRRREIIAAAEHCFVQRGFHQSSMQHIAAASGLSMGLLYRYFANKESIIEAVAAQDQEETLAAIYGLPDQGDVTAAWIALIEQMAEEAASPAYARLANEVLAEASRSPRIRAMLEADDLALGAAVARKLEAQKLSGALETSAKPAELAQTLIMLCEGLTMRRFMSQTNASPQLTPMVEKLVRTALR
jgi:TetR/AcrR family transcriptional regulator, repressor for uid operon